jgi:cobaltochelatase CobT
MSEQRRIELHKQRLDELSGAALRALAADPALHYRSTRPFRGEQRLTGWAPHLQLAPEAAEQRDAATRRALVDAVALRVQHSNRELHQQLAPQAAIQKLLFNWLEQMRVESRASESMPGQQHNLRARFARWSFEFEHSGQLETALGLVVFAVTQICWSRISGYPLPESAADHIEGIRLRLAPSFGEHFTGLRRHRADQLQFSVPALAVARLTEQWIRSESAAAWDSRNDSPRDESDEGEEDAQLRSAFALLLDFEDDEAGDVLKVAASGSSKVFDAAAQSYAIFTRQFDREVGAAELLRREQLVEYRAELDALVQSQRVNVQRLARELQQLLTTPERDGWTFGQEEGVIDGRRLSLLLSSPNERRLFKAQRLTPQADCSFTLLIDCSGSMKSHMQTIAVLTDLLARALDMAGVSNEVLGFTTGAWNGGRARQAWARAGSPSHPGRLNETLHIVFKPAEQRWRHARAALGALLKPENFREGVDGEAVQWGCERMLSRMHRRRLLLVISDGCPMDTATQQMNDTFYLDNHLRQVVRRFDRRDGFEIMALGVGLDLSVYYDRCVGIDARRVVDRALFDEIMQMIAGRHRHAI